MMSKNTRGIYESIDHINAFGNELECPADDLLLSCHKAKYYSPAQNRDGEVFVGGHAFPTKQSLIELIEKLADSNTAVQVSKSFEFVQGLFYRLFPEYEQQCINAFDADVLPKLVFNDEHCAWSVNPALEVADQLTFVIGQEEIKAKLLDDDVYGETSRTSRLNSGRLIAACPETTVFTTSYPMTSKQSEILRTILNSVDRLDLEALIARLLPSYLEAKRVSNDRSAAYQHMDAIDLLALVDQDESTLENIVMNIEDYSKLPTLKSVMSQEYAEA